MASPKRVRMTAKVISETKTSLQASYLGLYIIRDSFLSPLPVVTRQTTPATHPSVISTSFFLYFPHLIVPIFLPLTVSQFFCWYFCSDAKDLRCCVTLVQCGNSDRFPPQINSLLCRQEKVRGNQQYTKQQYANSGVREKNITSIFM